MPRVINKQQIVKDKGKENVIDNASEGEQDQVVLRSDRDNESQNAS